MVDVLAGDGRGGQQGVQGGAGGPERGGHLPAVAEHRAAAGGGALGHVEGLEAGGLGEVGAVGVGGERLAGVGGVGALLVLGPRAAELPDLPGAAARPTCSYGESAITLATRSTTARVPTREGSAPTTCPTPYLPRGGEDYSFKVFNSNAPKPFQ